MSSRVVGAGLALIAAALFAVTIATPAVLPAELSLFAGHRTVNGHTLEMQDAYVGFYKAQVCNTGGDGTCQNANPRMAFKIASFAELGVTGLAAVFAVGLALLTLRKSERRLGAARFVRIVTVIAVAGAGAMIVLGPTDQGTIPLGPGMGLYGAGLLGAFLASVIAARPAPLIKLRVADRGSQPVAAIPAAPPFGMQALFGEDPPRPGKLGPDPIARRDAWAHFGARGKPASIPPPLLPGPAPRTQVSLVPPMPDNDVIALPVAQLAPAARAAPLPPGVSDGNTEPNLIVAAEDPPQVPRAPVPRSRVETPLAPPPPPVSPAPRARRASPPLPRPMRDTQSPRPGLRAAVPMPERSARQAPGSTRPPPLSIGSPLAGPSRGAPPRLTIAAPVVPPPSIPPIPAIPMLASLAETDLQDRAETVEQDIDPATGSHDPLEIGDATSQTNVSFMVTAEELGFSEITAASAPLEPLDETGHALRSADTNSAMAPSPAAAPLPAAAVAPPAPLVRDRPMPKLPISTAPDSLPPPKDGKQQIGPSPACPQCESPMAWVEEHLRFYCKSCRMYF